MYKFERYHQLGLADFNSRSTCMKIKCTRFLTGSSVSASPASVRLSGERQLFLFFAHDDYTKMYQKMLTIEQFHNPALAAEFSRQYYDGAIDYQKKLFGMLAEKGNFIEADYEVMAVHFYGPFYLEG